MLLRTTARLGRRVAEQTHAWKRFSTPAAAPDLPPPSSLSKAQALSSSRIVLDFVRLGVSGRRLDALAAVQTELAPTIGYDGADGYVQLQVALMEHLADPAVAHATQAATHALCARAGITPPTSPPQ